MSNRPDNFPIDEVIPELLRTVENSPVVILAAPPGAGKTTRVPIALRGAQIVREKRILMLEPRRLAARRAAEFMASQMAEVVGQTVGYRIRGEIRVGKNTSIEVLTEGVLTRMLQDDPGLPGVGVVIFDEFHERSIHADLGLAFCLDVQKHLRPDLRILIMSATLDGARIASVVGNAPVVESSGKLFPIQTTHARFESDKPVTVKTAETILRALESTEGDVLAFLPGWREIRRTDEILYERGIPEDIRVHSLHGEAPAATQNAAIEPAPPGIRKVILSTNVAETSLTIEGVRVVVDSGLVRTARFDVRRGMSELVTIPISRASADQRRGRAGRLAPGFCFRIWTEDEHARLDEYAQPEIKSADLAPFALELAQWGSPGGQDLSFPDPPPAGNLQRARKLLEDLEAVDSSGKLTATGKAMAELPVHPRLAHIEWHVGEQTVARLRASHEERWNGCRLAARCYDV
ncbi:MAG TPA: ATP-dependent helicase HrpB, partial [Bacteroidota bacterium]|nr:ATP-dependent helicase HrpB [Bacteroidota bacterium]